MGKCKTCGGPIVPIPCPDGKPGCCVMHYGCHSCRAKASKERLQDEARAALEEANGVVAPASKLG